MFKLVIKLILNKTQAVKFMEESILKKNFFIKMQEIITKYDLKIDDFHAKIKSDNIFQPAITFYRDEFIDDFLSTTIEPESEIKGIENFIKLHDFAKKGNSCLILARHLGNFDVPNLYYLIKKTKSEQIINAFNDIIFIAGRKLNEEYPIVLILTSMFPRIVIIPKGETETIEEANKINLNAQRMIRKIKNEGKIILLYPTGTRERDWEPNSFRGIKETYNYIKTFDKLIFLNLNGNNLLPCKEGMINDQVIISKIVFTFSDVYDSKVLLSEIGKNMPDDCDKKQYVIDQVMDLIRSI